MEECTNEGAVVVVVPPSSIIILYSSNSLVKTQLHPVPVPRWSRSGFLVNAKQQAERTARCLGLVGNCVCIARSRALGKNYLAPGVPETGLKQFLGG